MQSINIVSIPKMFKVNTLKVNLIEKIINEKHIIKRDEASRSLMQELRFFSNIKHLKEEEKFIENKLEELDLNYIRLSMVDLLL